VRWRLSFMRRAIFLLLLVLNADAREVARVPARITNNRILLSVAVNEHPPSTFILDTGAARSVVEKEYADDRGIRATGMTRAMGAAGSVSVGVAPDLVFALGDIRLPAKEVPLIPLEAVNLRSGTPVQGILGQEAFGAYVVDLDYERGSVAFHDRRSFEPPRGSVSLPLHFRHHNMPQVDVRLTLPDGRTVPARLLLDTGAGPGLILTRAFVKRHQVEVPDGLETAIGLGVGGGTSERTGRLRKLEFGGFTFEQPIVSLSHSAQGVLGESDVDGILGGEILRRFQVQFDYGRRQVHLTKNAAFGDPLEIDMLGAVLAAGDDTFRAIVVQSLRANTPAAAAGLREGDELRAVNGRAVTPKELDAVRKLFRQADRRYELTIVREGKELVVPVTTRRFV
jgi:hypothetical protein